MPIKGIRAGSKSSKRQQPAIYTQSQVNFLINDRMQSYREIAHELRELILQLSDSRRSARLPEQVEVSKAALMRVLSKSADLDDL